MGKKQTLYEILGVSRGAAEQELQLAFDLKVQDLQALQGTLAHEDYDFRRQELYLARDTLMDPVLRRGYDEKLAAAEPPPAPALRLQDALPDPGTDGDGLARRADALALRAEALALRADALALRGDADGASPGLAAPGVTDPMADSWRAPVRKILVAIGVAVVAVMAVHLTLMFSSARRVQAATAAAAAAAKAEEQLVIQEYYQKYGVRPASAAEARLLEQEQLRKEREAAEEARRKENEENATIRFQEESRRLGERVSNEVYAAEERLRREESIQKARTEAEQHQRDAAEQARINEEQARMRRFLSR